MSGKELLSLSIGASLLPSFSLVNAAASERSCHGKICKEQEYCSSFAESCTPCSNICDSNLHNYSPQNCAKYCSGAADSLEPLKAEIHSIKSTQNVILLLLGLLLALVCVGYLLKCLAWLRHRKHWLPSLLSTSKHQGQAAGGKELNATTITNLSAINRDIERAPSQIYSVAGAAEGSVMTMVTPVSTRYPAENSTTPTTVATEIGYEPTYGYDNQAMVVTPIAEKPAASSTIAPAF
ncbi:hypothetical protein KR222_004214 [Zaprionus bogoriensis]|nr:hypothetical protein KR222_004214 [Zaprionus bogoriensis]